VADQIPLHGANGVAPARLCSFQGCQQTAREFPVIQFGPVGRLPGGKCAYRLEVPKAVCEGHMSAFRPATFVDEPAQAKIDAMLTKHGMEKGDYGRLFVIWKPLSDPAWAELVDGGQARLWF
jgi:hypothetical protein